MATSSTSTLRAAGWRSREWMSWPGSRAGRRQSPTIAREFWPATRCSSGRRRKGRFSSPRWHPPVGRSASRSETGWGIRFSGSDGRHPRFATSFEGSNRRVMALGKADLIEAAQQAVAGEPVDLEAIGKTLAAHLPCFEVDRDLGGRVFGRQVDEMAHLARRQHHREQAGLVAVGQEDVGEARRDDRAIARVSNRPGRVLTRRPAAEIGAGDKHRRALELQPVEREIRGLAPVVEKERAVAGALDALEELLGDDLVGVDVGAVERRHASYDVLDRLHYSSSRTSTRWPVTAAAAAIGGLIKCVRPPAPCRPSKFRLLVDAHRSPGARMSGFMPRHIEQPAFRHSKPAALNIASSPSSSAARFTVVDPGTTIARTFGGTCLPAMTWAAARRSSSRAFVHEPMNTRSMAMSANAVPGRRSM